jgi:hypothetical protein
MQDKFMAALRRNATSADEVSALRRSMRGRPYARPRLGCFNLVCVRALWSGRLIGSISACLQVINSEASDRAAAIAAMVLIVTLLANFMQV